MTVRNDRTANRGGVRGWLARPGGGPGTWAFLANRVSALVLVGYLFLHLGVLSLLARGPASWETFLSLAGHPAFIAVDLVLFAAVLWHAANGVRVAAVGTGLAVTRQRVLAAWAVVACVVVLVAAGVLLLGEV
ncbi:hypothetical protein OEB99_19555 [Actinotalea sp. M2MS4P-6]|uniref:hypothetical protein n=1 Tax=Actinotalea sp. M2MS4P-6 TaxID=2983762 RepID=UPI0021E3702F|nr:hypothetical protein [Actinotalea sp. M2MS4P-6]MCV2396512.1 hypothetical protein [Actinotalea sp. M2MS4P-6]